MMTPDYQTAAIRATETLIRYGINAAPVIPLPMLKATPNVLVVTFAEMALNLGENRTEVISTFSESQDAVTSTKMINGKLKYIVAYNQRLPFYMLQRGLARELGHIILGHDGSRSDFVRTEEAACFARHLICPRPLIKALQDSGIPLTAEILGTTTGCYERCLIGMRKTPGVVVPAELNRAVRKQFSEYIENLAIFKDLLRDDETPLADFGSYMDGYQD